MEEMNITSAKYATDFDGNNVLVIIVVDGKTLDVPMNPSNRHYKEILRQVEEGILTIAEAD